MMTFEKELEELINRHSLENGSNTPDFILAQFLNNCMGCFNFAVKSRETWYGRGEKVVETIEDEYPEEQCEFPDCECHNPMKSVEKGIEDAKAGNVEYRGIFGQYVNDNESCDYSVGEFVFCEFELQQIKEIVEGRIREVTDGSFGLSGYNLNDIIVKLTLRNKQISDQFIYVKKELNKIKNNNLNMPDIYRKLVDMWVECCNIPDTKEGNKLLQEKYKEVDIFKDKILESCESIRDIEVSCIKVFK